MTASNGFALGMVMPRDSLMSTAIFAGGLKSKPWSNLAYYPSTLQSSDALCGTRNGAGGYNLMDSLTAAWRTLAISCLPPSSPLRLEAYSVRDLKKRVHSPSNSLHVLYMTLEIQPPEYPKRQRVRRHELAGERHELLERLPHVPRLLVFYPMLDRELVSSPHHNLRYHVVVQMSHPLIHIHLNAVNSAVISSVPNDVIIQFFNVAGQLRHPNMFQFLQLRTGQQFNHHHFSHFSPVRIVGGERQRRIVVAQVRAGAGSGPGGEYLVVGSKTVFNGFPTANHQGPRHPDADSEDRAVFIRQPAQGPNQMNLAAHEHGKVADERPGPRGLGR
nr:hypothetical protein MIMGU_mgv1a009963mg [Ipomoea batatas]